MTKAPDKTALTDLETATYLRLNVCDLALRPQLDSLPVLLCGIDSVAAAQRAKDYLSGFFASDTPVYFCGEGNQIRTVLEKIDAESHKIFYGGACRVLVVPDRGFDKKTYTFGDLLRILEKLTGENGCPWDREQTHQSIRSNMIEEAYEAALAISGDDRANLIEELGDVLLQSVFHADIAKRGGEFELSDVLNALCRKLYTRHTHIFGDKTAAGADEAVKNWEDAKAAEKAKNAISEKAKDGAGGKAAGGAAGIKDYAGLPSLLRAQKIYKKISAAEGKKDAPQKTPQNNVENKDGNGKDGNGNKGGNKSGNTFASNGKGADFGRQLYLLATDLADLGIDAETELNAYLNSLIKGANQA